MFAVTAILSCIITIRGLFRSTKWRHFEIVKFEALSARRGSNIFNENLMAVHKIKEVLTLNRPAYVGMCILDLSKTLMYDFHYNYIKKKYADRAKLLFTDSDSSTYEIKAEDVYKDFWNEKDMFDNSDYQENSPYYCNTNKKVIGKFKDEACGLPITKFFGLKDVRDRSAIMECEVKFGAKILPLYSPLDIKVKQQLQSGENASLYVIK